MASQFNTQFKSAGTNVPKYSFSQTQLNQNLSSTKSDEEDYGEVEEFDYESYLEVQQESQDFDLQQFFEEEKQTADTWIEYINTSISELKQEQKDLKAKYSDCLIIGNSAMNDLISINGFTYATPEDYEQLLFEGLDPYSCLDEYGMYSQEIYDEKAEELKEYVATEYTPLFEKDFEEAMGMSYEEYQKRLEELDEDLTVLKSSKYALEQKAKEYPYLSIAATEDYQEFVKNYKNNIDVSEIDVNSAVSVGENPVAVAEAWVESGNSLRSDTYLFFSSKIANNNRFECLDDDDKMMYNYLYEKEGWKAAEAYIEAIEDKLNRVEGEKEAQEFIDSISKNGEIDVNLWNGALTSGKGIVDGIENFGEGIDNLFDTKGMISTNQYAQMYILDALQNSKVLTGTYQFSVSAGNMAPAMVASLLVSTVATPAAGSAVGSTLMGLSAGGNAKNQALVQGNDVIESYIYGTCIGLSETTLGYFLGKIPGLSATSGLSLKNLFMEGLEEFSQEWVDAGLQSVILQENVDWGSIPEQSFEAFVMGVAMAGIMNGGETLINMTVDSQSITITEEELVEALEFSASEKSEFKANFLKKIFSKQTAAQYNTQGLTSTDINNFFTYYTDTSGANYGVDQGFITKLYEFKNYQDSFGNLKTVKEAQLEYFRLKDKLSGLGYSKRDASVILSGLDSVGACSYAAIANSIFSQFRSNETNFKTIFGYDMYTTLADGSRVLNSGELLLDMYLYFNNTANGGTLFSQNYLGDPIVQSFDSFVADPLGRVQLNAKPQNYAIKTTGINQSMLDSFIQYKNAYCHFNSDVLYQYGSNNLSDSQIESIKNNVISRINSGYQCSLGIGKSGTEIRLLPIDPNVSTVTTETWSEGSGHAVFITDVAEDGFIVSSWGQKYLIPFDDLKAGGAFGIYSSYISW